MEPDRIVIGAFDPADADAVAALHDGIDAPIVRADVASAEMIKLAANAALMTRISFINEIANVARRRAPTSSRSPRGSATTAGSAELPQAGSDSAAAASRRTSLALKQLAANSGYHFQVLNAVIEVNELQKRRVIGKLAELLGLLRGKRIALLGLRVRRTRTTRARRRLRARRAAARGRRGRRRLGPDRTGRTASTASSKSDRRGGGARRGRGRPRDRVAASCETSTGPRSPRRCGARSSWTAEHARPGAMRAAGFTYDAIGRAAPTGLMEAIVLAGGRPSGWATRPWAPEVTGQHRRRPLLAWQLRRPRAAGVGRVIVSCLEGRRGRLEGSATRA